MQAKALRSPPGYPPSRLFTGQLLGSPASSAALSLLVVRCHLAHRTRTLFGGFGLDLANIIDFHSNVPRGIEKLTSCRSSTSIALPTLQIW